LHVIFKGILILALAAESLAASYGRTH